MAAGDLTTVEKVRAYLKIEDTLDLSWLAELVTASSAWVKSEIGRDILAADYTWATDGEGTRSLSLPQYPVLSVTSVTVDGEAIPARASLTDSGWTLVGDRIELVGYRFTRGVANVAVVYRAGYATVPADLEQAVVEHASLRYRDREWGPKTYQVMGGEVVDRRGDSGSMSYIRGVIAKYQRVSL